MISSSFTDLVVFYRIFEDPAHQVYSAVHCLVFKEHFSRLINFIWREGQNKYPHLIQMRVDWKRMRFNNQQELYFTTLITFCQQYLFGHLLELPYCDVFVSSEPLLSSAPFYFPPSQRRLV